MQITDDLYLDLRHLDAIYPAPGTMGERFMVVMENGRSFFITKAQKEAIFAKERALMEACQQSHDHSSDMSGMQGLIGMIVGTKPKPEEPKEPSWPDNL